MIYTPAEIARLLAAASPDFLPCIALGAFAGLRSAEIERLEWRDIDFTAKLIELSAAKSKTASRRVVPLHDNLAAWLMPYSNKQGLIWPGSDDMFSRAQEATAEATAVKEDPEKGIAATPLVKWLRNGLRHSYASYRLRQLHQDAGRLAGEMGNSPAMIFRHYHKLVKDDALAERWFSVRPESPANVLPMTSAGQAKT